MAKATPSDIYAYEQSQGYPKDSILNVMLFETGGRLTTDVKNPLSGATGLIQFMPNTAVGLGTTTAALASMTVSQQLIWVTKYLQPYKARLLATSDHIDFYLAVLYPAALGKPDTFKMASNPTSKIYLQNKGLDFDKDGDIEKGDIRNYFNDKVNRLRVSASLPQMDWKSNSNLLLLGIAALVLGYFVTR